MRHGWSMRCLWQGQREKLRKGCQRSHLGKVLGAPRSEDVQKENTSPGGGSILHKISKEKNSEDITLSRTEYIGCQGI